MDAHANAGRTLQKGLLSPMRDSSSDSSSSSTLSDTFNNTSDWLDLLVSPDHHAFIENELARGHFMVVMLLGDTCCSSARVYEAERIYRTLLEHDLPSPLEGDVQRQLEAAEQYQRKTKDPLVSLPPELSLRVLSHLSQHDRVVCTEVSRSWQDFIYQAPELWRQLIVKNSRYDGLRPFLMSQLHSLLLQSHEDIMSTLAFVADHLCSRLERLEIDGMTTVASPPLIWSSLFFRILPNLGKDLVHLHIATDAQKEHPEALGHILSACPRLVCLHHIGLWQTTTMTRPTQTRGVHHRHFQPCQIRFLSWPHRSVLHDPDFLPTYFPKLEHLNIREDFFVHPEDMTATVQRLHDTLDLKTFTVCNEVLTDSILPIQRGHRYDMSRSSFANLPWQDSPLCEPKHRDVRYLVLTEVEMDQALLQTLVLDCQDTLAWLVYLPDEQRAFRHETPQTLPLSSFHFPRLTHLQLSGVLPPLFRPLHAFFDACPALQEVRLRHIEIDQSAVQALLRAPVAKIELYESPLFYRVTDEPLMALAKGAAAQGVACRLQHLAISVSLMSQVFYNALLVECGHVATLRSLRLLANAPQGGHEGHPGIYATDESLALLIDHAKQSGLVGALAELELQRVRRDAMRRLQRAFPHLTALRIHGTL